MQITPKQLIDAMRMTDKYIETIFTTGGCYQLHLMLQKIWPNAIPVINAGNDHVGSLINGDAYDINGIVDWKYRAMDDNDIATAERWNFADHSMMQIGECPVCEEPLVA